MDDALDWVPLSSFGAKVELDLSASVSDAQIAAMKHLFATHHLIAFSGQRLSWEQQARVSGWFAPVIPEEKPTFIAPTPDIGGLGDSELPFHSDLSCTPEPLWGLSLHAVDVAAGAAPTFFIDAVAAAAGLPESLRGKLEGLHVLNLWPMSLSERQRASAAPKDWPGAVHPLLKPHPVSGEPILYLNASHTDRIVELAAAESEDLIRVLFDRLYDPNGRYEHVWKNGDLVIWDNLAIQHGRPPATNAVARTLQRVTMGTTSSLDLMPPQLMEAYKAA